MLGVALLVAAPVDDLVYRYFLRRQAREFAAMWIDAVRHGEVYKAHQLMLAPRQRLPSQDRLADYYRRAESARQMLNRFVKEPAMRTLFALGTAAAVRFYETDSVHHEDSSDVVEQTYAVTFPDERKEPETFFITLLMQRSVDSGSRRAGWTLVRVDGGVRPAGW